MLAKAVGAKILLFHAVAIYPEPLYSEGMSTRRQYEAREEAKKKIEAGAQKMLASAAKKAAGDGVTVEEQLVFSNSPYEAIIETAKKRDCELIVMASHGRRGLSRLLLGSETQKVLSYTRIPVLVVR